jgi:acetyl esterase/lipase
MRMLIHPGVVATCLTAGFALLGCFGVGGSIWAAEGKTELLWPKGAPGAKGDTPNDKPTLTVWLPKAEIATGTAVVICPGGGYGGLATGHEGEAIGKWLNSLGVAGIMLEYRHAGRGYKHPAPLQDAQRAIRTVRARAAEWKIAPNRIGIMGFSAGGHLASTAGTHFDEGKADSDDPIERVSCRPDFLILCYPVIALGEPITHVGSQENLLGKNAPPELIRSLSNEKQVTPQTPPTFLFHTDEDGAVPPENSIRFYLALHKAGVPAELHIFHTGAHGLGLAQGVPGTREWSKCCEEWLRGRGLLGKTQK